VLKDGYCRDCKTVESEGGDDNVKLCPKHSGSLNRRLVEALENVVNYAEMPNPKHKSRAEFVHARDLLREVKEHHDH